MEQEQQGQTPAAHESQVAAELPDTVPSSLDAEPQGFSTSSESKVRMENADFNPSVFLKDYDTLAKLPGRNEVETQRSSSLSPPGAPKPNFARLEPRFQTGWEQASSVIEDLTELIVQRSRLLEEDSLDGSSPYKTIIFPSEDKKEEEEERTIRYAASIHSDLKRKVVQEMRVQSYKSKGPCMIVREREHGDGHANTRCEIIVFAWGGECLIRQECVVCRDLIDLYQGYRLECDDVICRPCLFKLLENAISTETLYPPSCGGQEITLEWFFMNRLDSTDAGRDLLSRYRDKRGEYLTGDRTYCAMPSCSTFIKKEPIALSKFVQCEACLSFTCTKCKNLNGSTECCVKTAFDIEAEERGWKQCYQCSTWIEKIVGTCDHMMCTVCGATFCYTCGNKWKTCRCDGMPPYQNLRLPTVNLRPPTANLRQPTVNMRNTGNHVPRNFRAHYPVNRAEQVANSPRRSIASGRDEIQSADTPNNLKKTTLREMLDHLDFGDPRVPNKTGKPYKSSPFTTYEKKLK